MNDNPVTLAQPPPAAYVRGQKSAENGKTMTHLLKIAIHAVPGARRTEAAGSHGDALRVRLAAPPVDGKANAALIAWAAQAFGVGKGRVERVYGASGRHKLLAVSFASAAELAHASALLAQWRGDSAQPPVSKE